MILLGSGRRKGGSWGVARAAAWNWNWSSGLAKFGVAGAMPESPNRRLGLTVLLSPAQRLLDVGLAWLGSMEAWLRRSGRKPER